MQFLPRDMAYLLILPVSNLRLKWRRILLVPLIMLLIWFCIVFCFRLLTSVPFVWLLHSQNNSGFADKSYSGVECQCFFFNYTPSLWEKFWHNNIESIQNDVCERLAASEDLYKTISVTQLIIELQKYGRRKIERETKAANDILSKMFYKCECVDPDKQVPLTVAKIAHSIEPLVGLLRDPFAICSTLNTSAVPPSLRDTANVQSKRFLLLSISAPFYITWSRHSNEVVTEALNAMTDNGEELTAWSYDRLRYREKYGEISMKNRKVILFDIGSSYFNSWKNDSAAAAGLWFYEYYKRFNIRFDRIFAYEAYPLDQTLAWRQLPDDVLPIYTLINAAVTDHGKLNPWSMLQAVAHTYDHVVVKMDIDLPSIENELIYQLLNNSNIHNLVDELFFEQHVTIKDMIRFWGRPPGTLKDSYELFKKLREIGIRAHSWP